jgi:hypothetical protein
VVIAGEDERLALAASRLKPEPGMMDVVVHADGNTFKVLEGGAWKDMSPEQLAAKLKAAGHTDQSIRLVACNSGGADGAASRLAKELGVEVKAPTDTAFIHVDGSVTVGPSPDTPSGGWSRNTPDGNTRLADESAGLTDEAAKKVDEAVAAGAPGPVEQGIRDKLTAEEQAALDDFLAMATRGGKNPESILSKMPDHAINKQIQKRVVANQAADRAARHAANQSNLLDPQLAVSKRDGPIELRYESRPPAPGEIADAQSLASKTGDDIVVFGDDATMSDYPKIDGTINGKPYSHKSSAPDWARTRAQEALDKANGLSDVVVHIRVRGGIEGARSTWGTVKKGGAPVDLFSSGTISKIILEADDDLVVLTTTAWP